MSDVRANAHGEIESICADHDIVHNTEHYSREDCENQINLTWEHLSTIHFTETATVNDIKTLLTELENNGYSAHINERQNKPTLTVKQTQETVERFM